MANKTITIAWSNGSPRFNPPPGVTILHAGDTVTLQLVGVPNGGGSIDEVTIFDNRVVDGKDAKGQKLCGWTRSTSANTCTIYDIGAVSATVVRIVDEEHPEEDRKYWFSASGSGPGVPSWVVDPELINKPDGGG